MYRPDGITLQLQQKGQPFQVTMRRFGRKSDVEQMRGKLPLTAFLFDCRNILDHEALSDPDICLLYRRRPYPDNALIPSQRIGEIIHGLSQLRTLDETLYLRSASINIFNGLISLTFSCDGTHYMSWSEFLDKDMAFWVGSAS